MSEHETPAEETTSNEPPGRDRPDPRLRPPDPAGTQPTWDPDALLPREKPPLAQGRLWATGPSEEDVDDAPSGARVAAAAPAGVGAPAFAGAGAGGATADADATDDDDAPRYAPHSARFQFLLGALLAIGVAAVALLVAVVVGGKNDTTIVVRNGPQWSDWRPNAATGSEAADQIAQHVGAEYKLPNGKQLVGVRGSALQIAGLPVTIAIQEPAAKGGQVDFLEDGSGVMYRMDGIGTSDGRIPGTPSPNRHMLLRREALELALYSFRYLGVTETVVLLPPAVKTTRSATGKLVQSKASPTALLFQRDQSDVQSALSHPLTSTLAAHAPSVSNVTRSPDAQVVMAITDDKAYSFKWQEANADARAFLVLAPLSLR